jgi:RNAse (barnase) inhibitor barstar
MKKSTPKTIRLVIDCAKLATPAALHAHIAKTLHFLDYYGANLDALNDCLGDVLLEHKVTLVWKDSEKSKKDKGVQEIKNILTKTI